MSYIGQTLPADTFQGFTTDSFTGDGSATTFTLSKAPFSENGLIVVINNVIQKPTTNFTVSGTTLTIVGTAVASGDVIYATHLSGVIPSTLASKLDTNGVSDALILDADADTTISADTDDQIDIKIAGADDFQFTANTFTAQSGSTITTPTLGVGNTKDLGAGIHIKTADSGASVSTAADDLVIEQGSSGNGAGLSILSATDDTCNIFFGDSGDNDVAFIQYNHSGNEMVFTVNTAETLRLGNSMDISTGGETAPDVSDGGICLDQGSDDTNILSLKSSDVAHGITSAEETDTYFAMRKQSATNGGTQFRIYSSRTDGEHFQASVNGAGGVTTKSASATSNIMWTSSQKSGTGINAVGTDDNIFSIHNYTNTQFIFDAEGTFHSNVGTATYDEYDDAHLVRAMDLSTSTKGLIASKFDEFIQYNHEDLANAKIVGREEDGTPNSMVNWTAMSQLHNGAIWQQYEKHQRLAEAVYEMAKEALGEDKADAILEKHDIKLLN